MSAKYRVIILDEHGTLREKSVSLAALRTCILVGLFVGVVIVGAAFALGRWHRGKPPMVVTERAVFAKPSVAETILAARDPRAPDSVCSTGMILIEGSYCPDLLSSCKTQMDPVGNALHGHRCAEYKQPAHCQSLQKKRLRYCIDRDEHVASEGGLPHNRVTFDEARQICQTAGKRLCSDTEWTFACEGEAGYPYPYGWRRDSSACNADREGLVDSRGELTDRRTVAGAYPKCVSPFGVRDLTGNLEEYVMEADSGRPVRKGGYWQPGPNHCRHRLPHQELGYRGVEVGFRCCADPSHSS